MRTDISDSEQTLWSNFMEISVAVSHLLVVLNCSLNFILYCFKDSKFRKIVKSVMCHMGRWRAQQVTNKLNSLSCKIME